jgi:hypothetical protein
MNPLRDGCACGGCEALRAEVGNDAALAELYGKKLLRHGWAGHLSTAEKRYRKAHSLLAQNSGNPNWKNPALRLRT